MFPKLELEPGSGLPKLIKGLGGCLPFYQTGKSLNQAVLGIIRRSNGDE